MLCTWLKWRRLKNETPNSTELLKKQFWHPGFSFLKFKEKIYQIRKEVMLFLRNCDQSTVFFCGWMVLKKKKKKLMTFKWRWKIASFYFWITLQDCLDKEYNFHMICIIINLIVSARRGMKPTSASTFLLLTCWWRLRIPLLKNYERSWCRLIVCFFPKLNRKKFHLLDIIIFS